MTTILPRRFQRLPMTPRRGAPTESSYPLSVHPHRPSSVGAVSRNLPIQHSESDHETPFPLSLTTTSNPSTPTRSPSSTSPPKSEKTLLTPLRPRAVREPAPAVLPSLARGAGVRVIPPPVIPANTGIHKTAHPHSIESDHETPFPLPDDDIEPIDPDEVAYFNLSPEERKNTPNPSASSAPSA